MESILVSLDYIGVFVFAITGALVAAKSEFDFFGMLFLAFLTAIGGGTVRDIILDVPVFWLYNPSYLYTILAASALCLLSRFFYTKVNSLLFFLDTVGLGLFAIIGTQKALTLGVDNLVVIIMGVITAVLGGILRSIFNNEVPIIFKNEIYATTAAISSVLYLVLVEYHVSNFSASLISILVCIIVRYSSVKYNLHLPKAF